LLVQRRILFTRPMDRCGYNDRRNNNFKGKKAGRKRLQPRPATRAEVHGSKMRLALATAGLLVAAG
jgi:hypothetical protein